MSSEEDDYMSDKFLTGSVDNDIRPGLIKSHSDKRSFQVLKRKIESDEQNKKKNPNLRVLESEKRKEGLEKPIEVSNKGFAMLQRMGYKPGSGIGKTDIGRTEPIPINLKADREGLGRSQMKKEILDKKMEAMKKNTISTTEYRSRITERVIQKQTESDLRKSQKICEHFDIEKNTTEPFEKWYWFSTDPENDKEEKLDDEGRKRKKLYSDYDSDLDNEVIESEDDLEDTSDEEKYVDEVPLNATDKLCHITTYLRETYFYCIWCSVKYNDKEDLEKECPGRTRDDH